MIENNNQLEKRKSIIDTRTTPGNSTPSKSPSTSIPGISASGKSTLNKSTANNYLLTYKSTPDKLMFLFLEL